MPTPCFLLERNGWERVWLRRHASIADPDRGNPCGSYHNAQRLLGDYLEADAPTPDSVGRDDECWPPLCDGCGYAFHPVEDDWQVFGLHLYEVTRSVDDGGYVRVGGVFHVHPNDAFEGRAPAGAMWYADWVLEQMDKWDPVNPWWHFGPGPDGHALEVRTPGGDWHVDSRASNCGRPGDNDHRCWCRSGDAPLVTVDKSCETCAAGAGSIQAGDYHGFLVGGVLS